MQKVSSVASDGLTTALTKGTASPHELLFKVVDGLSALVPSLSRGMIVNQMAKLHKFLDLDTKVNVDSSTNGQVVLIFRKSLEDLLHAISNDTNILQAQENSVKDFANMCTTNLKNGDEKDEAILEKAKSSAKDFLDKALGELRAVAFASNTVGKPWSSDLKAKSTMVQVHAEAEKHGLHSIDKDGIEIKITALKAAFQNFKGARECDGPPVSEELSSQVFGLELRATLSLVEESLLTTCRNPPKDADRLRASIQAQIKRLRALGCKEKEHLPSAMFQWALSCLTGRR